VRSEVFTEHVVGWIVAMALLLAALLLTIFAISFLAPPTINEVIHALEHGALKELLEKVEQAPLYLAIFLNNAFITLLFYVPFLGLPIAAFVIYNTARVAVMMGIAIECLLNAPGIGPTSVALGLILSPHTYLELLAYGIALFESTYLTLCIVSKKRRPNLRNAVKIYLASIPIAYATLFIAAIVESTLIHTFTPGTPTNTSIEELIRELKMCRVE